MPFNTASVVPVVTASEALLRTGQSYVHWVTVGNTHATETPAIELNDSTDDTGTDRWAIVMSDIDGATSAIHCVFDPPIFFETGVFLDITNGTVTVMVGISGL